ncbi:hypothetical protein GCM10023199_30700 [Actinomycetospora chibensis]
MAQARRPSRRDVPPASGHPGGDPRHRLLGVDPAGVLVAAVALAASASGGAPRVRVLVTAALAPGSMVLLADVRAGPRAPSSSVADEASDGELCMQRDVSSMLQGAERPIGASWVYKSLAFMA